MKNLLAVTLAALVAFGVPGCASSGSSSSGSNPQPASSDKVTWKCADGCGHTKQAAADKAPQC